MGDRRMIYTITLNPAIDYVLSLEEINLGKLNRIDDTQFFTGGKGINVSRVLKNLEYNSTVLGFIGGFTGDFIQKELREENLITDFIKIDEKTRINVKIKEQKETELNGSGPEIDKDSAQELLNQLTRLNSKDTVIISGSKARNLPIDYYQQMIQVIKDAQADFVIDTTGEELENSLKFKPLLVKPNDVELAELFNVSLDNEADYIKYGKKLIERGAQFAIVSLGGEGAILFSEEGIYKGNTPKGTVKNTVGAGDSMVAGFVGTYLETKDLIEAFKISLASGSATAFKEDLATKDDIEDLLSQIHIKEL